MDQRWQEIHGMASRMKNAFYRSEVTHQASMAAIMSSMTFTKTMEVLKTHNLTTPALMEAAALAFGKRVHLRKQPTGYAGIDGARKLLNDMIYESMVKYDAEIAKCTDYYASQCGAMEACRGQIAASNYIAANSRSLILDSQSTINQCEVDIPEGRNELEQHNMKCEHELKRLRDRLKVVSGDIAIMTTVLEMTDCEGAKFLQMEKPVLLRCKGNCTKDGKFMKKSFVTFDNSVLRQKLAQLQSSFSHQISQSNLADLFEGIQSMDSAGNWTQLPNKTDFNNPPVPVTRVSGKPSPYPRKWVSKCGCHLGQSPQCFKLQGRFLLIQSGIQDEEANLLEQIAEMERTCDETRQVIETQIANDQDSLSNAQTKLAASTEKEANAGEIARQTAKENEQLNDDLVTQMKKCSGNYINFETEMCALKKIRGELYKMQGGGHDAFFQDCEVGKWEPEECTQVCNTGEQTLTRGVMTAAQGGADCLPLTAIRKCNTQPCPVDCELSSWSEWSKCSAKCGGGIQQRLRDVKRAMRYGGKPCGTTSESIACNGQACEKDCELSEWTQWSLCSKDCDGGTKKRQKFIKTEPEGEGSCPDAWSKNRLEYEKCAMFRCELPEGQKVLTCNKTLDIVLLLDGSASMGAEGFANELEAAQTFIDAFSFAGTNVSMAVILFSGPRTWSGVSKCTGKNDETVNAEEVCKIKTVSHFTSDLTTLKTQVAGLEFPEGGALTSLALLKAKAELQLGRKDAMSNVVVFSAGRPLSYRKTLVASRMLRKMARLVWVPVSENAPLASIKTWATRRWQENVVALDNFEKLKDPEVITHIVADICPKRSPVVELSRN